MEGWRSGHRSAPTRAPPRGRPCRGPCGSAAGLGLPASASLARRAVADDARSDPALGLELTRLRRSGCEVAAEPGGAATLLYCVAGGGHGSVERGAGPETLAFVPGTMLLDAGVRRAAYRLPAMDMHLVSLRRPVPPAAWPFDEPDRLDRCCGHVGVEWAAAPLIDALWRACGPVRPVRADTRADVRTDALRGALGRLVERVATGHARARFTGRPASVADPRLMRALWHIEANLDEALDIASLGAVTGLSPYRFAHVFAAAVGVPPHRYVMRRRLERSVEALEPGGASLVEVAAMYGFSSQQHYTKRFGEAFGLTPGRWRAGQWRARVEDGGGRSRLH